LDRAISTHIIRVDNKVHTLDPKGTEGIKIELRTEEVRGHKTEIRIKISILGVFAAKRKDINHMTARSSQGRVISV
jgi:hypothetical protein